MGDVLATLIDVFAPTIAQKFKEIVGNRRLKGNELNTLLVALVLEQNSQITKALNEMNHNMIKLGNNIGKVLRELKTVNEGIAVLLKRTES